MAKFIFILVYFIILIVFSYGVIINIYLQIILKICKINLVMSKIICINADINRSGNIMRKAISNCLTTNGIEGFVVSPVRITPKGYYPYKQVS